MEGGASEQGIPLGAYGPVDRCGGELLFFGEHPSPHEKCFHFPRGTFVHAFSSYEHVYSFSSGGRTKCTPNHGCPAYHLYQIPMVQNTYTKAVENSDMPPQHFNGLLENYDEWVEKLQQWLGVCDPTYRKANEARILLTTLPPWLKGIINKRVAQATQHTGTAPTLKELWDFSEHRFHEYDPSRADERWRALNARVVKGQVCLIDLEEFYTRWQCLLPSSNETRPHMSREQLLRKRPWIQKKVVKKEAKNSQGSYVVDFSSFDPSPGRGPFEKELRKYSAQRCTTVPEGVSDSGPGLIVDCKDPYLQEWFLQFNNTPHTNGYTMKVGQRRPRWKPEDIYALAHEDVSQREAVDRPNRGDKATVTCTHRPSFHQAAVNAVNADATADPLTAEPIDTSVNAVGQRKPPAKKAADPGSKPPTSNQPVWVPCSKHWRQRKQMDMDYRMDWGVTNSTLWTCKPESPCNDSHWVVSQKNDWAVKGGKPKGS